MVPRLSKVKKYTVYQKINSGFSYKQFWFAISKVASCPLGSSVVKFSSIIVSKNCSTNINLFFNKISFWKMGKVTALLALL